MEFMDLFELTDEPLTPIPLRNEQTRLLVRAGTVVFLANRFAKLKYSMEITIQERGATNYDNRRRAVNELGIHLFWIQGVPSALHPGLPQCLIEGCTRKARYPTRLCHKHLIDELEDLEDQDPEEIHGR